MDEQRLEPYWPQFETCAVEEDGMSLSTLAGSIMFILGSALLVLEIVLQFKDALKRDDRAAGNLEAKSIEQIEDLVTAAAMLMAAFSRFSERIQRLILGTALMLGGAYLISNQPF
jgi:hypothetical protein